MSVQITYFVHGTTTDNEKDISTGWLQGELSPLGIQQAKELGDLVKGQNFDAVFCSDLKRATDSAALGFGSAYEIIPDPRLRECNYGDRNGSRASDFKDGKMDYHIDVPFPGGESYMDVQKRIENFLSFLKANYDGKHIAIVAHEGPQLALDVLLRNRSWPQAIAENWRNVKEWKPGWQYVLP